ncbi:MAG: (2Fe-2S)-binding protein [Clostridia bacterium]
MRIEEHPILTFPKGKMVKFYFCGKELYGKEGEPIVAALHDNNIKVLGYSNKSRPRGLYCAIGNCSSCLATVNGEPNVRTCVTPLQENMQVEIQHGKGVIK